MKHLFFLVTIVSLAISTISCKSKKEATSTTNSSSGATTENSTKQESKFALVVSFISKGAGVDGTKTAQFITYVTNHPKKPDYITIHWGREGETDYCFKLKEFTDKEAAIFIDEMKKIAAGSDMMIVSENAVSVHKGR